jgi:hypothetical protein
MRALNCVPDLQTGSVAVMTQDIGRALRRLGLDVANMQYRSGDRLPREMPRLLDWLTKSPDGGLLIDINGRVVTIGLVARANQERPGTFICFTFLTDTPLHFTDRLRKWPADAMIGYVDRSFPELIEFMGYDRPSFIFHPHAGPPAIAGPAISRRDIDILFIGNVAKIDPPSVQASRLLGENRRLVELFIAAHGRTDQRLTPFQTVRRIAMDLGGAYTVQDIALVAGHLELYLSNTSRVKVLSSLASRKVTIVGNIADGTLRPGQAVTSFGYRSFRQCVDLMSRAKILVNVVPSFPNGGHERVFYAMSRGAAVLTTRSTFLAGDAEAHGFVGFIDPARDDVSRDADTFLGILDAGARDRDAMLGYYTDHHTWEHRLAPVLARARERFA